MVSGFFLCRILSKIVIREMFLYGTTTLIFRLISGLMGQPKEQQIHCKTYSFNAESDSADVGL